MANPSNLAAALLYKQEQDQRRKALLQPQSIEDVVQKAFGMQPGLDRATFLPMAGTRSQKNRQFAAPGIVYNAAKALATPLAALRGANVTPEDAFNVAGNVMGGGLSASALRPVERGVIGANVQQGRPRQTAPNEFDIRFDPRAKEQEKLRNLVTQIESRNTVNPKEISITELEGKPFITSMSDRTAAGGMLTGVNNVPLNIPVNLQGGQDFMFENPGMVWSSAKRPVNQIQELASAVKSNTGQDPLYIPWRMAPTGGDFATMTGETMLNYADATLSKRSKNKLNKLVSAYIPNWAGVGTEQGIKQFRNAPDKVRKTIKNEMDMNFRDEGGLGIGEARLAVSDPNQRMAAESGLQNVGLIYADAPMVSQSGHPSYPFGVPGEGIGKIKENVKIYDLLKHHAKVRGMKDRSNPSQQDIRALQMKPYYGLITADILKDMGF